MKRLLAVLLTATALPIGAASYPSRLYVGLADGPVSVSRINAQTGDGFAVFTAPFGSQNMALTPDGTQAYVLVPSNALGAMGVENAIYVYNLPSGTLMRTIALSGSPWEIYFSPDGTAAYVVGSDGLPPPNGGDYPLHLFAIDTATGNVVTDLSLPQFQGPFQIQQNAISPDGNTLYVAVAATGKPEIAEFCLPAFTLVNTLSVTAPAAGISAFSGLAITPNGADLLVNTEDNLSVYSAMEGTLLQTIPMSGGPIVVSPDSKSAYTVTETANSPGSYLAKLNLTNFKVTRSLELLAIDYPPSLILSPNGETLLVENQFADPQTLTISVPNVNALSLTPRGSFTPSSQALWVLNSGSTEVLAIDPPTNNIVGAIAVPDGSMAPGERDSLVFSTKGLAIASTKLNQVVRSAAPNGNVGGTVISAGGNAYINTVHELISCSLSTLQYSANLTAPLGNSGDTVLGAMAVSSDGSKLYIDYFFDGYFSFGASAPAHNAAPSCDEGEGLLTFDTSTNENVSCIGLTTNGALVISPDGSTAYVGTYSSNGLYNAIATVDLATQTVGKTANFTDDSVFFDLLISPDGKTLYGRSGSSLGIAVIDAGTLNIVRRFPVPAGASAIVITPDGSTLYLPNSSAPAVIVIDTATGAESSITLPSAPSNVIAIAPF